MKKNQGLSLKNGVDMSPFVRKTRVFCVVPCDHMVLVQIRVSALCST